MIDGKRNLTPTATEKFILALALSEKEARFFKHLVLFNQAKTESEKLEHYSFLQDLSNAVSETVVEASHQDFYDIWYLPILREILCSGIDCEDNAKVAKLIYPPIQAKQVKDGVLYLEENGFIEKVSAGQWKQTNPHLTTGGQAFANSIKRYHQRMLGHAAQAIDEFPREERFVVGVTMGLSKEAYETITAEYQRFREKVLRIVDEDEKCENVYQLILGMYPSSQNLKKGPK